MFDDDDEIAEVETDVEDEAPARKVRAKIKAKPAKATAKPVKAMAKGKPAKAAKAAKANGNGAHKAKAKRKPRTPDPAKLDQFGLRKGSKKSQAAAMYATKKGATLAEVKDALESTQFNVLTELENKGFKIDKTSVSGDADRKVTRYKLHV